MICRDASTKTAVESLFPSLTKPPPKKIKSAGTTKLPAASNTVIELALLSTEYSSSLIWKPAAKSTSPIFPETRTSSTDNSTSVQVSCAVEIQSINSCEFALGSNKLQVWSPDGPPFPAIAAENLEVLVSGCLKYSFSPLTV